MAKFPLYQLEALYDQLTSLGLDVVPKKADAKLPLAKYWKDKGKTYIPTKTEVMLEQTLDYVSGWCIRTGGKSRLYVVDIDLSPDDNLKEIQKYDKTEFLLKSPSGGYHIYYRVPDNLPMLTNAKTPLNGVDGRGEGGQVVTVGGFNTYVGDYAKHKGVEDGHVGTYTFLDNHDYSTIPTMSSELYHFLVGQRLEVVNYGKTEEGKRRLETHFKQTATKQETIVLECLRYVLDKWSKDKTVFDWLQLVFATHHGCNSLTVRDYILNHPNVEWKDGQTGRQLFVDLWATHKHREDGYTVATLFYLAKQAGWLGNTGYEISDKRATYINSSYVPDYLASLKELPKRMCLQSQTGSGKTQSLIYLYNKLSKPKTVVFVPTTKLATELAGTLTRAGLPAVLYIDKDAEVLTKAQLLITTLQTFASKVYTDTMKEYGLVYIEESDQLLSSFARGGGGMYGSHVRDIEAVNGFKCLRSAYQDSEYVYAVDATMTSITVLLAESMSSLPVNVVVNKFVKEKAKVSYVDNYEQALQLILRTRQNGKSIVVSCDTASQAQEVKMILDFLNLAGTSLLITGSTERNAEVSHFLLNVETEASKYDTVIYNSVMGSGVSITSFCPDVVVQICGYLSPRNNLQMLNRYRQQSQVFVYYRTSENLYNRTDKELLEEAKHKLEIEAGLVGVPIAVRNDDALLRATLSTYSVADVEIQNRSPRAFYSQLLKRDGREVIDIGEIPVSEVLQHTREGVKEAKKQQRDFIRANWNTIPPITRDNPALPEYDDLQVALGERHGEIFLALRAEIPKDVDPTEVDKIVNQFEHKAFKLSAFLNSDDILKRAEEYIADESKAITSISNNITALRVISLTKILFPTLDEPLTKAHLQIRHKKFMQELSVNIEAYNSVITNKDWKFEQVYDPMDLEASAIQFSKVLLSQIGLKQRSDRGEKWFIENLEDAKTFLKWRWRDEYVDLTLDTNAIDGRMTIQQKALRTYNLLSDTDKVRGMRELMSTASFVQAVAIVTQGIL